MTRNMRKFISISMVFVMAVSMLAPFTDIISEKLGIPDFSVVYASEESEEPEGTEANPFTIVEIVPDINMATLGFMIDGAYESSGLSMFDYSAYTTKSEIDSKFGLLAVADSEESVLTYAANGVTEITVDEYNQLSSTQKDGFVAATIEKTNQIGYYTESSSGKYVIDEADAYSPSTNGNYMPVVEYFVATENGNYNAYFDFDNLNATSTKYSVGTATAISGGDYEKINCYIQDTTGTACGFLYSPSSTARKYNISQITTYAADSATKGLYIKQFKDDTETDYYYVFSPNSTDVETYDISFYEDEYGEYIYSSSYSGECSDVYKYSFTSKYKYKQGAGNYSVTFVQDGAGKYVINNFQYAGTNGKYNAVLAKNADGTDKYEEVSDGSGYFVKGLVYTPRLAESTDTGTKYSFTVDSENYIKDGYDESTGYWWFANQTIQVDGYTKDICTVRSNDFFRTKVLGVAKENAATYVIDYKVMAASDVGGNVELLGKADYIYIADYVEDEFSSLVTTSQKFTTTYDLSWTAVMAIMDVVVKNRTPLVINYTSDGYNLVSGGSKTSIRAYQLPLFCAIYGADRFYNYFMNNFGYDNIVPAIDGSGNYSGLSSNKGDFGQYTFIPDGLEMQSILGLIIGDMSPGSSSNNFDYTKSVIENVYFNIKGNNILGESMNNEITIDANNKNYSDMYEAIHGSETTITTSSAGIFGYLINYNSYYPNSEKEELKVMNIQPCADFSLSSSFDIEGNYTTEFTGNSSFVTTDELYLMDGELTLDDSARLGLDFYSSTYLSNSYIGNVTGGLYLKNYTEYTDNELYLLKLYFRNFLPNFYGPIKIYTETSGEFIGDKEDYVATYDAIYFGLNTGKMNVGSSTTTEGYGKTLYNDSRMDGLIYTHVGDRLIGGSTLSGLLEGGKAEITTTTQVPKETTGPFTYYVTVTYTPESSSSNKGPGSFGGSNNKPGSSSTVKETQIPYTTTGPFTYYEEETVTSYYNTYLGEMKEYYDTSGNDAYTHRTTSNSETDLSSTTIKELLTDSSYGVLLESYRYSGNDLSAKCMERLQDFVNAGCLVLAEKGLADANNKYIDDSSNLYSFFSTNKATENVVDITEVKSNSNNSRQAMEKAIANPKIKLKFNEKPLDYVEGMSSFNSNMLNYKFVIDDAKNKDNSDKYTVELFIDIDSDGIYEDSEMLLQKKNQPSGVELEVSKRLSSDYSGIIPWKIVAYSESNSTYKMEEIGYTCVVCTEKEKIHVLQITSDSSSNSYVSTSWTKSEFDMEYQAYRSGSDMNDLLKSVVEFELIIDTVTVSEFVNLFVTDSGQKYTLGTSVGTDNDMLSRTSMKDLYNTGIATNPFEDESAMKTYYYDMLIIGFADSYSDFYFAKPTSASGNYEKERNAVESALDNVEDFIKSGKGVLVAHDTTSYNNMDYSRRDGSFDTANNVYDDDYYPYKTVGNAGFGMNKLLRKYVGMDRFGITDDEANADKYDTASMPSQVKALSPYDEYIEQQGYSTFSLKRFLGHGALNSTFTSKFEEVTGITPSILVGDNAGSTYKKVTAYNNYGMYSTKKYYYPVHSGSAGSGTLNQITNVVSKANDGQITNYPFIVDNKITISYTHAQYYQLDMEDEEVIVWYCLADDGQADGEWEEHGGVYSEMPNDVRNNYYIYTKGNVTYTGAGHSAIDDINELKLFINTIIAAYVPEKQEGTINILNSSGTVKDSAGGLTDVIYTYLDSEDDEETSAIISSDGDIEIEFMIENPNLTTNITFGVTDSTGASLSGCSYKSEYDAGYTSASASNRILEDTMYTLKIPRASVNVVDREADNSYLVVINLNIDGASSSRTVKIVRRSVFDMR